MRILLVPLLLLIACPQTAPEGDDDSGDDTPEPTPEPIFDTMTGTVDYEKTYTLGPLEGTVCTERFSVTGPNVTESQPNECATCEHVYQFYVTTVEDNCQGGADLQDSGLIGFDLRPEQSEAIVWLFYQSWGGDAWEEGGTGTLVYDTLTYGFADPDNGSWIQNTTTAEPCGFLDPCQWNGEYSMVLDLGTNGEAL